MGNKTTKPERERREVIKEQKMQEVKQDLMAREPKSSTDAVFNIVKIEQLNRKDSPLNKTDLIAIVLRLKGEEDVMGVIYQRMTMKDLNALIRLLIYQGTTDSSKRKSSAVKSITVA